MVKKRIGSRKLFLVLSLLLLFDLFLFMSFVSASVFSDFFNNIGGEKQISSSPIYCKHYWHCPVGQVCSGSTCELQRDCDPDYSIDFNPQCSANQVCNPDDSKCTEGECYYNKDCLSPFKVCEHALCVQKSCSSDDECPVNNDMSDKAKCISGICIKPMCDKNLSSCGVNGVGICYNSLCLSKQCSINSDCLIGKSCDNGLCFQKQCEVSEDCPDFRLPDGTLNKICINSLCKNVQCLNDQECEIGYVCDKFQCVQSKTCKKHSDCQLENSNRYCIGGSCSGKLECDSINDCPKGFICNGVECTNTCNLDSECPDFTEAGGGKYQCKNKICCLNGECPNLNQVNNEICSDGKDNDGDGLIDYKDPQCVSQCLSPKQITSLKLGNGLGAPAMLKENNSIAGCCLSTQCYAVGTGNYGGLIIPGCRDNLNIIETRSSGGSVIETEICSSAGTSSVWCKKGFVNDGDGNCVQCNPNCGSKICGQPDDCGSICIAGNSNCIQCTPQCSGKTCGSDNGCGEVCETGSGCTISQPGQSCSILRPCPGGQSCFQDICRLNIPPPSCPPGVIC